MPVSPLHATTTLSVEGMSCPKCVAHVTEALQAVPGVSSAVVVLETGRAVVIHSDEASLADLVAAVEEEGYSAKAAS